MKIAIHGKNLTPDVVDCIDTLFATLHQYGTEIYISRTYYKNITEHHHVNTGKVELFKRGDDLREIDFFFSLGGDGTLLESVTYVGRSEVPIVGINTGRLGFLATSSKENIKKVIEGIYNDYFTIENRSLVTLDTDKPLFEGLNFALNEFTILKKDSSSMIVVHTFINGEYLNSYWSDGLIIATPTGSTGYSLSCGGPLILPQANNFVITPVSPHNLNVRPMVVPDSSVISFEIEGRSKSFLVSLDSRSNSVDASIQMAVRKSNFHAKLVKFHGYNFLDTLRQKLNWGLDMRN
ncbi:NAD kinase [Penaeicola halotolerans]|uniref:NAD kinase n=1 Tax=Penaeicola halotolerans TaxID=2793196 RepID=UPI001CF8C091|nr:NAD kinase [Penaeicola halotolerans]